MRGDECTDRRLQLCDAAMGAAAQLFVRKSGEPPLAEVQPGHRGLVRAAVVHDPMHVEVTRHGGIDWIQELPKRRRPMSLMKRGDQLAGLHVGRGEQGGVPCRRQSARAPLPLAGAHRHELRTPGTGAPARNPAAARGGMGVRRWASGEQRHPAPRETWPPSGEPPRLLAPPRFRAPRGGVLRRVSSQTATSPPSAHNFRKALGSTLALTRAERSEGTHGAAAGGAATWASAGACGQAATSSWCLRHACRRRERFDEGADERVDWRRRFPAG